VAREGHVVARDGVRIAFRDHGGEGRPLVLLHGGGANLVSMDQYAQRLGRFRRTVAMDIRACGQSGDPARFRLRDAAGDVEVLVDELGLGAVDVVGHSMGGFVAGWFGTNRAESRVVSIDGFGPGMVTVGSEADRAEFRAFQDGMRSAFFEMTSPPESGDRRWRDDQIAMLIELFPRIGYTAPNAAEMAARNLLETADGVFERRPPRHLFADAFEDDGTEDILRMYRQLRCPTLIIRCTDSGAPAVLDAELDGLAAANPNIRVARMPLTHLAPAWDAIDDVIAQIEDFLGSSAAPVT
jgi:pimeloyl-ACP methyl ester carboxylesterase